MRRRKLKLDWFFQWSDCDKFALKAEPWNDADSFAFWISPTFDGEGCHWESGYGDKSLGVRARIESAIAMCERYAFKVKSNGAIQ